MYCNAGFQDDKLLCQYVSVVNTTQKIPVQYNNRVFDYFYSAIIKLGEFYVQQLTDHDIYKNNSHLRVLI